MKKRTPTLSPSSPGEPAGPTGPGRPTGPCTPSLPAGPWGPFSPCIKNPADRLFCYKKSTNYLFVTIFKVQLCHTLSSIFDEEIA